MPSNEDTLIISNIINYVIKYKDSPYVLWTSEMEIPKTDGPPFWGVNLPLPDFEQVYNKGMCCAGLANILRRYQNLQIPGNIKGYETMDFSGGTNSWFHYLKITNRLENINFQKYYPTGTLLIQDYNPKDQGHIAITIDENKILLESKIIHSINDKSSTRIYNSVVIETLKDYYNYKRHTHICLPNNWLLKN